MRYIVGYSRKLHFFARAIMWFTKSDKSHCYIRQVGSTIEETKKVDYVLEANKRGVNLQWHSVFLREGAIVVKEYVVNVDEDVLTQAWADTNYELLNRPYSYMQIFGDAWVILVNWLTGRRVKNPLGQPWKDVCSEALLFFLKKAKLPLYTPLDLQTVSPQDIDLIMSNDPQCTEIPVER